MIIIWNFEIFIFVEAWFHLIRLDPKKILPNNGTESFNETLYYKRMQELSEYLYPNNNIFQNGYRYIGQNFQEKIIGGWAIWQ